MTTARSIRIEASDEPAPAKAQVVDDGLDRYNHASAPLGDVRNLAAFAEDASGRVVGGALGRTWGDCCELLQLWVDEPHRKAGVGSRVLEAFEARARARGCTIFYLTTLSFQAPGFYRRHGYEELARIEGYPDGVVKYLMQKKLTASSARHPPTSGG